MTRRHLSVSVFLLVAVLFPPFCGVSTAQDVFRTEYTQTSLIPEYDSVAPGGTVWLAIRQEIRPGWHVFWSSPGDAGFPLSLSWNLPEGSRTGATLHPVPEYFPYGPLAVYGHGGQPVFLVPLHTDAVAGTNLPVRVSASWQVCKDICVPEEAVFSLLLPVAEKPHRNREAVRLFSRARRALPGKYEGEASFRYESPFYVLTLEDAGDLPDRGAYFFPVVNGLVDPGEKQEITVRDGKITLKMVPGYHPFHDDRTVEGVLGYTDSDDVYRGLDISATVVAGAARDTSVPSADGGAVLAPVSGGPLPFLLAGAFLGGILLNVMPCVFPVLFIKAVSLVRPGKDMSAVRAGGIAYAAGVLVSFLLAGGVLLLLRYAGIQAGWGFHLQSPPVVILSCFILFLAGLHLAGVFRIGDSLAGTGNALASKRGYAGSFFTGVFAVVVAAPCLGPFLAVPMGAVLFLHPVSGVAVLLATGAGFAAPFLLVSLVPGLHRRLPPPGSWMNVMKQAAAFPVFGAAAYFLWVFTNQTGYGGLAAALAGAVILSFSVWFFELTRGRRRLYGFAAVLAGILTVVAVPVMTATLPAGGRDDAGALVYGAMKGESYDAQSLSGYRKEGTPVFIAFTAAWCITCQFDRLNVFSDRSLAEQFRDSGTVFMVADWTRHDPDITRALSAFNAGGIPFYVYYDRDGNGARVPGVPLTGSAVRKTLSGAGRQMLFSGRSG